MFPLPLRLRQRFFLRFRSDTIAATSKEMAEFTQKVRRRELSVPFGEPLLVALYAPEALHRALVGPQFLTAAGVAQTPHPRHPAHDLALQVRHCLSVVLPLASAA